MKSVADPLGIRVAGVFDRVVMHTPLELAEEARRLAASVQADCCVVVGGGSTIGFGKAIALTSALPLLAVPTTYSGSEMTTIWGISAGGAKTGRDPKVLLQDGDLRPGAHPRSSAARRRAG